MWSTLVVPISLSVYSVKFTRVGLLGLCQRHMMPTLLVVHKTKHTIDGHFRAMHIKASRRGTKSSAWLRASEMLCFVGGGMAASGGPKAQYT